MGKIIIYICDNCKINEKIVYPDIEDDKMPDGWFKKTGVVKTEYLCPKCYSKFTQEESLGILGGD